MSNFSIKAIEVQIKLGAGTGHPSTKNHVDMEKIDSGSWSIMDVTICDLPCSVEITKAGAPMRDTATIEIWGLSLERMKKLTNLSYTPDEVLYNRIIVKSGEQGGSMSTIFIGEISSAKMNFTSAPNVKLVIEASTGFYAMKKNFNATSIRGKIPFVSVMSQLAKGAGFVEYRNEFVTAMVDMPYFSGSAWIQIMQLATQYGVDLYLDNNVLTTVPKGMPRSGYPVLPGSKDSPILSPLVLTPETGLTGYPAITDEGVDITALLQPNLVLGSIVVVTGSIMKPVIFGWANKIVHKFAAHNAPEKIDWFSSITMKYTQAQQNLFPKDAVELAIEKALEKLGLNKEITV